MCSCDLLIDTNMMTNILNMYVIPNITNSVKTYVYLEAGPVPEAQAMPLPLSDISGLPDVMNHRRCR
jgi:hypothetical protein